MEPSGGFMQLALALIVGYLTTRVSFVVSVLTCINVKWVSVWGLQSRPSLRLLSTAWLAAEPPKVQNPNWSIPEYNQSHPCSSRDF